MLERLADGGISKLTTIDKTFEKGLEAFGLTKTDMSEKDFDAFKKRYLKNLALYQRNPELSLFKLAKKITTTPNSVEDKMTALHGAMDNIEKQAKVISPTTIVGNAEALLEKKVQEGVKKAEGAIADKIGKIPLLGSWLKDAFYANRAESTNSEHSIKGMIGGVLLSIFGGFFGIKNFKGDLAEIEKNIRTKGLAGLDSATTLLTDAGKNIKTGVNPDGVDIPVIVSQVDTKLDTVKNISEKVQYKGGFRLLLGLSGVTFEDGIGKSTIEKNLENITYKDFVNKKNTPKFRDKITENNEVSVKQYDKISEAMTNSTTTDLLEIGLSGSIMTAILKEPCTETLTNQFSKGGDSGVTRVNEIRKMIHGDDFDYTQLTISEISILYIRTVPALTSNTLGGIPDAGKLTAGIGSLFLGENTNFSSEIKKSQTGIFSAKLLAKIGTESLGSETNNMSLEEVYHKYDIINEKDKKDFKKLYDFKKYLLGEDFLNTENKLLLGDNHIKLLKQKLNFKSVAILYGVMGGHHIEELNALNTPIMAWTLHHIMSSGSNAGDSLVAANYIGNFGKKALTSEGDVFSDKDKRVMDIYKDKILDITILSYLKEFYGTIGLVVDYDNLLQASAYTFGAGAATNIVGNKLVAGKMVKNKLPILGSILKKAGWLGMILGAATAGTTLLTKSDNINGLGSNLERAYDKKDTEKVIKILEEHKSSIKEEINDKGEKVVLVAYPGEDPYVVYNNKVYVFATFDQDGDMLEDVKGLVGVAFDFLAPKDTIAEEKQYVSNFQVDNDNVTLQPNGVSFNFFSKINTLQETSNPDLKSKINTELQNNEWTKKHMEGRNLFGKGEVLSYIPVYEYDDDKVIALVEIGNINKKNES